MSVEGEHGVQQRLRYRAEVVAELLVHTGYVQAGFPNRLGAEAGQVPGLVQGLVRTWRLKMLGVPNVANRGANEAEEST